MINAYQHNHNAAFLPDDKIRDSLSHLRDSSCVKVLLSDGPKRLNKLANGVGGKIKLSPSFKTFFLILTD